MADGDLPEPMIPPLEAKAGLLLFEIGNSRPPIYGIVDWSIGDELDEELARFIVDENSCPSNFLGFEVIERDDTDPHGVLRFVQYAQKPSDWPFDGEVTWERYCRLFDKLDEYDRTSSAAIERAARALCEASGENPDHIITHKSPPDIEAFERVTPNRYVPDGECWYDCDGERMWHFKAWRWHEQSARAVVEAL